MIMSNIWEFIKKYNPDKVVETSKYYCVSSVNSELITLLDKNSLKCLGDVLYPEFMEEYSKGVILYESDRQLEYEESEDNNITLSGI